MEGSKSSHYFSSISVLFLHPCHSCCCLCHHIVSVSTRNCSILSVRCIVFLREIFFFLCNSNYVTELMKMVHQKFIALDKMLLFFNPKILIFFLLLHENLCCGYWLEAPHWGTSNEYPHHMFLWRNKKNIYLGPVVQSIVSLMSLLSVISLTILVDSIYSILIFFAEKMWVAFALQKLLTFFQQKISAYLRITWYKF